MRRQVALLAVLVAVSGCGPKPIFRNGGPTVPPDASAGPSGPSKRQLEILAKPWLGTPYRYGGVDRRGIDCSALAQTLLGDLGANLPRTVRAQKSHGKPVPPREMAAGDLVFFRLSSTRVDHVGIALDRNRFVHSSSSRGVVIDHLMEDYFSRRFAEVRRVLERD